MAKNPLGKGRDVESPYATFEANGFEYRIAKTYKLAKNEAADQYARWNVYARSPFTENRWEGPSDTYRAEVLKNMQLTYASPEFIEAYRDDPAIMIATDAALIAAAPELLTALKALTDKAQSVMGDHKSVIIDARAAIKTATTICNPSS